MFNREIFRDALAAYKRDFIDFHWKNEQYKWEAVKCFQDNWDVQAEDLPAMLKTAFDKTYNLLASMNNFPRQMLIQFASAAPDTVRAAFIALFDESRDLIERVEHFKAQFDALLAEYGNGAKQHYQGENAISTYLWLRYPDKYYIYKYSEIRAISKLLVSDYAFKKGAYAANLRNSISLYNEICSELQQDSELRALLDARLTANCYPDPQLRTMAIDVGFYISRYYSRKNTVPSVDVDGGESAEEIDVEKLHSEARYKKWFVPLIDALLELDGRASRPDVHEKIIAMCGVSDEELEQKNKSGSPTVINDIDWARNYLTYEGILEKTAPQGIWQLSALGESIQMTDELAGKIIGKWVKIKACEREKKPVPTIDLSPYYQLRSQIAVYKKEDFLTEVYMAEEKYDTLAAILRMKKNIILQGAPGVGKTFAAKRLAYAMMGVKDESRVEFVQFHQNYSYEDFIMGYKPTESGFKLTEGIFFEFCDRASKDTDRDYFFIIDEINRGNMSKIFGELLMLIEKDYRNTPATLAYSKQKFSVPDNVYLIGMMNTADRSLAMIDYALRRRFSFFEMEPAFDSEGFVAYQTSLASELLDSVIDCIKELNRDIRKDASLGNGFCIGHSYFCNQKECSEEWLKAVVYYDILPMLREYWFDDPGKVDRWESRLSGVFE